MKLDRWRDSVVAFPEDRAAVYRAQAWGTKTIAQELHAVAQERPNADAVIGPGVRLTYAELDTATDRIGAGLLQRGLVPGDAVLLQADNSVATVLAWYGLIKAALVPVATLSVHRGNEIRPIAALTRAAGHLVQPRDRDFDLIGFARTLAAETDPDRQVLVLSESGADSVLALGADLDASRAHELVVDAQRAIDSDDVAVFQLSGGTTGVPKVIPRQHAEYWYNARAWARRLEWDHTVRTLHIIPLVHNAGIVCALHAVHSVGGAFVVGTPKVEDVLATMIEHGITDSLTPPGLAVRWADHPLFDRAVATMRRIALPGSEITDELFEAFESRGVRVLNMFGMGEGLCMATPLAADRALRQHSIGYPLAELDEVKVLEPAAETEVGEGEIGELCARGPYTLRGYLAAPERNAVAFTSDGFYRTGDLVSWSQTATGRYYTFEGRAKDLVNRGGEKINSAEIEGLVGEIPGLRRAALIPVPDERLGERACLCVEMATGAARFTLDRVRDHLQEREVAKFKWPEFLEYFDELPTTPSAKIDKRRLSELVRDRISAGV